MPNRSTKTFRSTIRTSGQPARSAGRRRAPAEREYQNSFQAPPSQGAEPAPVPDLPPSLGYTHVALRAVRRIVVTGDSHFRYQDEFVRAVLSVPNAPIRGDIARFIEFHGLDVGDIIDLGESEFDVFARFLVEPGFVRLYWSSSRTRRH